MKMYPDQKLPLKPDGFFERFWLYTFESRKRWLVVQAAMCVLVLGMWALSQYWIFGVLAGLNLIHVYLGLEARAISRMIHRASGLHHDKVA